MDYASLITQPEAELLELERTQSRADDRDRVRFLRYLKTNQARSQRAAGALLGVGERQSQRWWQAYRRCGLAGLVERGHGGQYKGKLSAEQLAGLEAHLREDGVGQLAQAQTFLKETYGLSYSLGGLSALFARHGIKPKRPRPTNVRQGEGAVEEFKKNSPP